LGTNDAEVAVLVSDPPQPQILKILAADHVIPVRKPVVQLARRALAGARIASVRRGLGRVEMHHHKQIAVVRRRARLGIARGHVAEAQGVHQAVVGLHRHVAFARVNAALRREEIARLLQRQRGFERKLQLFVAQAGGQTGRLRAHVHDLQAIQRGRHGMHRGQVQLLAGGLPFAFILRQDGGFRIAHAARGGSML
jgi:hypothetical protein